VQNEQVSTARRESGERGTPRCAKASAQAVREHSMTPFEAVMPSKPVKASNLVGSVTLVSRWGGAPTHPRNNPPPPGSTHAQRQS